MTTPTTTPPQGNQMPRAILRLLGTLRGFSAQSTIYALALSYIGIVHASSDPTALPAFVAALSANAVYDILKGLARGQSVPDDTPAQIQRAIDASAIAMAAQPSEIRDLVMRLFTEQGVIEQAARDHQLDSIYRLLDLDTSYAPLLSEIRSQLAFVQMHLNDTATHQDIAPLLSRLDEVLTLLRMGHPAPQPAVPHSIPPPPADFTGRDQQIDQTLADLRHSHGAAISGVAGMGGVGKTMLAFVVAHRIASEYPDGQIYVDLKGTGRPPLSPADAMSQVIRAFQPDADLHQDTADELAARYRTLLTGKRALLLFDNAFDGGQVKPLLPPDTNAVLITSRRHFALPGLPQPLSLDVMSEAEACELLLAICRRIGDRAADIAQLCGRLPLALRIAASTLAEHDNLSPEQYVEHLKDRRTRVGQLKLASDPSLDVEAAFQVSYDLLAVETQARWRALAVFPCSFDLAAVVDVWAVEQYAARALLGEFVRASVVEFEKASERYSLHDLLADFADPLLSLDERHAAQSRHANHYLQVAGSADRLYLRGGDALAASLRLFYQEWPHIKAGQAWAAANADADRDAARACSAYPTAAAHCLNLVLKPRLRTTWLAPALAAARQLADRRAEGHHLGSLGNAYANLGEILQAITYYSQGLVIAREIGDLRGEGIHLGNLGTAYHRLGEVPKAFEYHGQALAIARKIGDRQAEGAHLGNLGIAYAALGKVREAIPYYVQALAIAREIGDRQAEGNHLGNLGAAYNHLGKVRHAAKYHEEALAISRAIGDRRGESSDLGNLGAACHRLGDLRKAIEYHQQALAIACEIGDRQGEGTHLGNLASSYYSLGEMRKAISFYEKALEIAKQIGDQRGEAAGIRKLGIAHAKLGEVHKAISFYEKALAIDRAMEDRRGEGKDLGYLGSANLRLGQVRKATEHFKQGLAIVFELDHSSLGGCFGVALAACSRWLQAASHKLKTPRRS